MPIAPPLSFASRQFPVYIWFLPYNAQAYGGCVKIGSGRTPFSPAVKFSWFSKGCPLRLHSQKIEIKILRRIFSYLRTKRRPEESNCQSSRFYRPMRPRLKIEAFGFFAELYAGQGKFRRVPGLCREMEHSTAQNPVKRQIRRFFKQGPGKGHHDTHKKGATPWTKMSLPKR